MEAIVLAGLSGKRLNNSRNNRWCHSNSLLGILPRVKPEGDIYIMRRVGQWSIVKWLCVAEAADVIIANLRTAISIETIHFAMCILR